jgi:hypothetical protein
MFIALLFQVFELGRFRATNESLASCRLKTHQSNCTCKRYPLEHGEMTKYSWCTLGKFPSVVGGHLISLFKKRRDNRPPPLRVEGILGLFVMNRNKKGTLYKEFISWELLFNRLINPLFVPSFASSLACHQKERGNFSSLWWTPNVGHT